jgi:hypothetical protein
MHHLLKANWTVPIRKPLCLWAFCACQCRAICGIWSVDDASRRGRPMMIDIAGQRFGRLVAVRHVHRVQPSGRKRMIWECLCDCGTKSTVDPWDLRTGRIQSCGCLRAEMRATIGGIHARFDDVTGQRFGRLIALAALRGRSEGSGRARTFWNCLCDCGEVKAVDATALRTGHIQSCGCLRAETATQQMRAMRDFG